MDGDVKPASAPIEKAKPSGMMGALVSTAPVVLTILSTVLAGLSNSELGKANYIRMLASQTQSKIADQWSFFQAHRIRGNDDDNISDHMRYVAHTEPFDPEAARTEIARLVGSIEEDGASPAVVARTKAAQQKLDKLLKEAETSFVHLTKRSLPACDLQEVAERAKYDKILEEIEARKSEKEIAGLLLAVKEDALAQAITTVERNQDAFDKVGGAVAKAFRPYLAGLGEIKSAARSLGKKGKESADAVDALAASFKVATLDYDVRRYRQESDLNRIVAQYYEISVRHLGAQAERYRDRSFKFFLAMLLSQLGAVVAAMALARFSTSDVWALAAFSAIVAGAIAICFGIYVYMST